MEWKLLLNHSSLSGHFLQSTENIKWSFRLHPTPQQMLPAPLCRNISDFLQFTRNPAWQKQKEMRKFWLVSLLVLERETSRRWRPTCHMLCCKARWPFPGRRHEEESAAGQTGRVCDAVELLKPRFALNTFTRNSVTGWNEECISPAASWRSFKQRC